MKVYCRECKYFTVHDYGDCSGVTCDYPENMKIKRKGAEGYYHTRHFKSCHRINRKNDCKWFK